MRAPIKSKRGTSTAALFVRLGQWARVEAQGKGTIVAVFEGEPVSLGKFGADAADSLRKLRTGLPFSFSGLGRETIRNETELLVRRLASSSLLEYPIRDDEQGGADLAVIEPQALGYWPRRAALSEEDTVLLSRFAYMRRREDELVLESPRSKALVRLIDPRLASLVAALSTPQKVGSFPCFDGFPGMEFLSLLLDGEFLFKTDGKDGSGERRSEGGEDLVMWDFHDLLFHSRSTEGRHANPLGGLYLHQGVIEPKPALRPSWPGAKISLREQSNEGSGAPPIAKLLRERHSTRAFDDGNPIALAELAQFLDGTARVLSQPSGEASAGEQTPAEDARPYPSAGASWELEIYLTVNNCRGLAPGFYHYDAGAHALVKINAPATDIRDALLGAAQAMGESVPPQILVTIAARFGRVSWKYSSIAYALILKDTGVLIQTLYLMACGMGLGGCALGISNIEQFARMTGIEFHIEGPVGQFALGRPAKRG